MTAESNLPAARLEIAGPQLVADRKGYLLNGERIDGFSDRLELDVASRRLIATWARAFTPSALDAKQRRLLSAPPRSPLPLAEALRQAAIENAERDMPLAIDHGLYALLNEDQLRAVREPWTALTATMTRDYPVSAGELAELSGTTARQIRHWHDSQLLPGFWIDGRRHFFSAAAVHAFALAKLDRNEIRGASRVLSAEVDDPIAAIIAVAIARSAHDAHQSGLTRWLEPKELGEQTLSRQFYVKGSLIRMQEAPSFPANVVIAGIGQWAPPPPIVEYEVARHRIGSETVTLAARTHDPITIEQLVALAERRVGHTAARQKMWA
jgi:DNA-binding transcriptional MerR regulator